MYNLEQSFLRGHLTTRKKSFKSYSYIPEISLPDIHFKEIVKNVHKNLIT